MRIVPVSLVLLSLVPLEVLREPAPLASISLLSLFFLAYAWPARRRRPVALMLAGLALGVATALVNAAFSNSVVPLLSYASFCLPVTGFFAAFALTGPSRAALHVSRWLWVPVGCVAVSLAHGLLASGGYARTYALNTNSVGNTVYGAAANARFFGADYFGTYGVNSFAGICLSITFLCTLWFVTLRSALLRSVTALAAGIVFSYGFLLQSRAFFLGALVFLGVYLFQRGVKTSTKVSIWLFVLPCVILLVLNDSRVAFTIASLGSADMSAISSNRSDIWAEFLLLENLLVGSAFSSLELFATDSTSYHVFALTAIAKGGMIFALPLLVVILSPVFSRAGSRNGPFAGVARAAFLSFLVQSLVWDVYAVQYYGHVAWFFVGLQYVGTRRRPRRLRRRRARLPDVGDEPMIDVGQSGPPPDDDPPREPDRTPGTEAPAAGSLGQPSPAVADTPR